MSLYARESTPCFMPLHSLEAASVCTDTVLQFTFQAAPGCPDRHCRRSKWGIFCTGSSTTYVAPVPHVSQPSRSCTDCPAQERSVHLCRAGLLAAGEPPGSELQRCSLFHLV